MTDTSARRCDGEGVKKDVRSYSILWHRKRYGFLMLVKNLNNYKLVKVESGEVVV